MPTNSDIQKRAMLDALEKSLGIVTTACKQVGIARSTHYEWMQSDSEYKEAVESIADIALDFAESQLHKQIQNGEVSSTIFYLKTKGRKRGYSESINNDEKPGYTIPAITIKYESNGTGNTGTGAAPGTTDSE